MRRLLQRRIDEQTALVILISTERSMISLKKASIVALGDSACSKRALKQRPFVIERVVEARARDDHLLTQFPRVCRFVAVPLKPVDSGVQQGMSIKFPRSGHGVSSNSPSVVRQIAPSRTVRHSRRFDLKEPVRLSLVASRSIAGVARISCIETLRTIMIDFCSTVPLMLRRQASHATQQFGPLCEASVRRNRPDQRIGGIETLLARAVQCCYPM